MSGLFIKKVRRNYRTKANDSDEEIPNEQESLYEQGAKGTFVSTECVGSSGIKKSKSVLSFEDDLDADDGDEFKVKKSNLSRRISKQSKEQRKKRPIDPDGIIKVVSRKEPFERKVEPLEEQADSEEKLECLRKQLLDLAEEDGHELTDSSSVNPLLQRGAIPDAAAIHLARKQREKAKIMLESSEASTPTTSSGRVGSRHIVSDDDDDDDEEYDDASRTMHSSTIGTRRPAFVVSEARDTIVKRPVIGARLKHRENELNSIREEFLAAEHGSDRDSDQDAEWERQQIQKALISQNPAVLEALQPTGRSNSNSAGAVHTNDPSADSLFSGLNTTNITLENVKKNLLEKYEKISASLSTHKNSLEQAHADLECGRQLKTQCRNQLPNLAKKFSYVEELKTYVDDLVECFNEKMSKIEYLEKRSIIILRERYQKLVDRRRQDMKDLADLATQPALPTTQQPKNSEELKLYEARRRRCAERESRRMRRQRARENVSGSQTRITISHVDGTSTDDEEPHSVIAKRQADLDALLVDAGSLFEDVVDEYCHLPSILQRFADWQAEFPQSYTEAYVALCLPQLFSPLVRLQLIGWNPVASNAGNLDQMEWFRNLLDFACPPSDVAKSEPGINGSTTVGELHSVDEMLRLLPYTVEKVVLKRLTELVSATWDPLSQRDSIHLVELVRDLTSTYPTLCTGSRFTEQLFETIVKRMEVTIQEDIFIPLYPKILMLNRQGSAFQFFNRQFHIGLKLLKNILLWHNLISDEALQHISLTCLVNRYLLVGLASVLSVLTPSTTAQSTSEEATKQQSVSTDHVVSTCQYACERLSEIIDLIPREWMPRSTHMKEESVPQNQTDKPLSLTPPDPLAQLRRFLTQLLDRCSSRSSQLTGSIVEREWITILNRFKVLVG